EKKCMCLIRQVFSYPDFIRFARQFYTRRCPIINNHRNKVMAGSVQNFVINLNLTARPLKSSLHIYARRIESGQGGICKIHPTCEQKSLAGGWIELLIILFFGK